MACQDFSQLLQVLRCNILSVDNLYQLENLEQIENSPSRVVGYIVRKNCVEKDAV